MTYDVAFRHQQALDPSALTKITTALHAIQAAITDCRNSGKAVETDSAVILLTLHLAAVSADRADDAVLRQHCMTEIAELRRFPALRTLAYRGVAYDEAAKRVFHAEGRTAMRRLAEALCLDEGGYDIRTNKAGPAVSGEITLHGEEVWVQLSLSALGPDNEIVYRRVRGRSDHLGDRNRRASVRDLLAPDSFAARIRTELALTPPVAEPARLFA